MSRPPLHRQPLPFITLPNWVKAAAVCGFPIQPVFDRLGVQTDLIHLEEATIAQPQLDAVMEACVAQARLQPQNQHFPFVLGETFAFDYLPDIGTFLATSPTLREAARVFEWVRALINPMIDVRLEEDGDTGRLILASVAETGSSRQVAIYFVESIFAAIAKFARMLDNDVERFSRLRLRHEAPEYVGAYERYFRLPVLFGQRCNAIELPRAQLDVPLEGGFPALHGQAEVRVEQRLRQMPRPSGLIAAVEAVLEAQPRFLGQGIERVGAELKLHPRTLQRRLRDEGESFADLQARVRYRLALRELEQGARDLDAISEYLGFSDRRSFTRAFSRWSGTTPSRFRRRRGT